MLLRACAIGLLVFLIGCTSQPLHNVENTPIPEHNNGSQPTMAQIEQAIISAAAKRRWSPKVEKPGLVSARIEVRSHTAEIEIPYSRAAFSIHYRDSENLDYHDGKIHRNYNRWIANLAMDIQQELLIGTTRPYEPARGY